MSSISEMRAEVQGFSHELGSLRSEIRQTTGDLRRLLFVIREIGLPANVSDQIAYLIRIINLVTQLIRLYFMLQAARLAAGDPTAWLGLGISAVATGMTLTDTVRGY